MHVYRRTYEYNKGIIDMKVFAHNLQQLAR